MGEYGLVGVCACQRKCSSMSACACEGTGRGVEMTCGVTVVAPDLGGLSAGRIHFATICCAGGDWIAPVCSFRLWWLCFVRYSLFSRVCGACVVAFGVRLCPGACLGVGSVLGVGGREVAWVSVGGGAEAGAMRWSGVDGKREHECGELWWKWRRRFGSLKALAFVMLTVSALP